MDLLLLRIVLSGTRFLHLQVNEKSSPSKKKKIILRNFYDFKLKKYRFVTHDSLIDPIGLLV